jgi:RNase P subunit RPR2
MATVDEMLRSARSRDELRYVLKKVEQNQLAKRYVSRKDKHCPKCRQFLDYVVSPTPNGKGKTIIMCHHCGWNKEIPYGMDEGRQIHEKRRLSPKRSPAGATRVIMTPDGKISRVI